MSDALPMGPSFIPQQSKPGDPPVHFANSDMRPNDKRIVAVTIGVRANLKQQDREFSCALCMHEIPVYKRFYELLGGAVTVEPGWVPLLNRHRRLTRDDLLREMERMRTTFIIPRQNNIQEVCHEFFGNEPAQQVVRLHALMRDQWLAWERVVRAAKELTTIRRGKDPTFLQLQPWEREAAVYDFITTQDLDSIVAVGQPQMQAIPDLEEIEVPELAPAPVQTPLDMSEINKAADAMDDADPSVILVEKGRAAGLTERQSLELASLVALADTPASITDDDIAKVLGSKAKLAIARSVIGG